MAVLIIGAGIAGLTTALSLHQIGVEARVFESVENIEPLGVGINALPHAVRELTELGLADRLAATAVPTAELAYYSKHGQLIWSEPRGLAAGYNWPQFSIHRGELQMILLAAARERLGADQHRHRPSPRRDGRRRTTACARTSSIAAAASRSARRTATLLIGADGIHSAVRGILYPDEGPPLWNGAILWRGVTRGKPFLTGRTMIMAGHEFQKFVCYPISRAAMERGEAVINWIAERKFRPDHPWRREDWNRAGDTRRVPAALRRLAVRLARRARPDPRGGALLRISDGRSRSARRAGRFGPVTLLGDAAHPMYPIGSNGASQAILDARVLAREIDAHGATEAALRAYEAERRPATAAIVLANRRNGPEQVMQLVEERAPDGFARIERRAVGDGAGGRRRGLQADRRVRQGRPQLATADRA